MFAFPHAHILLWAAGSCHFIHRLLARCLPPQRRASNAHNRMRAAAQRQRSRRATFSDQLFSIHDAINRTWTLGARRGGVVRACMYAGRNLHQHTDAISHGVVGINRVPNKYPPTLKTFSVTPAALHRAWTSQARPPWASARRAVTSCDWAA